MARTEAQKRADAKYRQKVKGRYVNFSAHLQKGEADELEALLKKHGLTHADFVRRSAEKLKNE